MADARRTRGVRRYPIQDGEEIQVTTRLPQDLVDELDRLAKEKKISRARTARYVLEAGLRAGGDVSTLDDLLELREDLVNTIKIEIVEAIQTSNSINSYRHLTNELAELKQSIAVLTAMIAKNK